ncbi:MAG: hypothetical protein S4CHLAM20_15620 [Chlamydiia bacterium]|nr:hypothetical protein [Chlamydiia bacterium]
MQKTVLITNGRFFGTLDLIRNLSENGVRVIVAETTKFHLCAYSNANAKNFLIPSPRKCEAGFIQRLLEIMKEEQVDLFIPGWEDVLIVSKHLDQFPSNKVFTSDFALVNSLHNKWEFSKLLTRLGYSTPTTFIINSQKDLQNIPFSSFYLKYCYSRASNGTIFIKDKSKIPKIDFDESSPIIAQEPIFGNQYSTYSICHNGKVTAHATYPYNYLKCDPSKSRTGYCLSFEEVEHVGIYKFVEDFVDKTKFTGSIAFDIFEDDGVLKILECNPRLTAGVSLVSQQNNLASAYFNEVDRPLFPKKETQVQYAIASILYRTVPSIKNGSIKPFILTTFKAKDIVYHSKDLKPFFFQPILGIYLLYIQIRFKKPLISAFSHDLDYEGEY